jgi:hypothetical protein
VFLATRYAYNSKRRRFAGQILPLKKRQQEQMHGLAREHLRWSRFPGLFGGKAKMDSGFDYAASFSSIYCLA